jgi:O-antigen/teichoic acid export membrane protein
MKLGWNLAAGFANSAWTAIVWLAAVPFYLRFLGVEAYGLIGFFITMQALFALLDMGLAPTINRSVARSSTADERAGARDLLHTLARVYWTVATLIAAVTVAAAPLVGRHWLNASGIPVQSVTQAVMLMGLIVSIRFPLGLYLGALMGAQRIVVASGIEMAMVTIANLGAIVLLARVSPTIQVFFLWQAGVGLLNVVVVRAAAWRALRAENGGRRPRFDATALRRIWRFSAGMALTAVLGTIFMQSDKVILSKIVSLEDLGRYSLAGLAARSLYVFMTPVFNATYPRLSALHAAGATEQIEALYTSGTRLLMAVVFPLAVFVAVFSVEIFTLWTGDAQLAQRISLVVPLLLLGTALNAAMHFPYALQLACGKSNLPAQINLALILVFVPLVISLALKYGILGGAGAWAVLNLLYLLLGTWVTHRSLLPGVGLRWIVGDVALPLAIAAAVAGAGGLAVRSLELNIYSRLLLGSLLAAMAFMIIVAVSPELVRGARRLRVAYL